MNLHIHHVFSDVDGLSAPAIISAIIEGERDGQKLAALRHKSCRSSPQQIVDALRGDYRDEYLFVLRQCQQHQLQIQAAIAECDSTIAQILGKIEPLTKEPLPAASYNQRQPQKNMASLPIYEEAWRFYGVDLSAVPGVGGGLLSVLMSEVGSASKIRSSFKDGRAFASWLALCPDNRISGGRVLRAKTRKVTHRLATALRLAAFAVSRADNAMGDYCRKMKARLGKAEGIVAVAHKLARVIYAMVTTGKAYTEAEAFKATPSAKAKRLKNLQKQAKSLNMQLVPAA
jgi:transposase